VLLIAKALKAVKLKYLQVNARESENMTMQERDQNDRTADPTRERADMKNEKDGTTLSGRQPSAASQTEQGGYEPTAPVRRSGRKPGEVSPELGQDSGSDWQESQQMGKTGHGGAQNPQTNP
jgi:hypothetical protein